MRKDVWRGYVATLPLGVTAAVYGSVLGVLAGQKGLSWLTLLIMDFTVFTGSAQFVMVNAWETPLPIISVAIAAAVINLRYFMITASLVPMFRGKPLWYKLLFAHFVTDENWAVTMNARREGKASTLFLLGGGLCIFTTWAAATMAGWFLGAAIQNPEALGLDFVFVAVFAGLAVGLWRGKADLLPWAVAAVAAVLGSKLLGGNWYIVIGGGLGALVAALRKPRMHGEEATA